MVRVEYPNLYKRFAYILRCQAFDNTKIHGHHLELDDDTIRLVNNEKLKELCEKVKQLIKMFDEVKFIHVLRAKNGHADRLSTLTLQKKESWSAC